MKSLFALLMLGFMLILVAPVQAMQTDNNCGYGYNIDNVNAPPGEMIYTLTVSESNDITYFEMPGVAINPESPVTAVKNSATCQYEATSRSWVNLTSETVSYNYLLRLDYKTGNIPNRNPRDGL